MLSSVAWFVCLPRVSFILRLSSLMVAIWLQQFQAPKHVNENMAISEPVTVATVMGCVDWLKQMCYGVRSASPELFYRPLYSPCLYYILSARPGLITSYLVTWEFPSWTQRYPLSSQSILTYLSVAHASLLCCHLLFILTSSSLTCPKNSFYDLHNTD